MDANSKARQDEILRLSETDLRAALLQLASDVPAAVDNVLQRLHEHHARQEHRA